MGARPFDVDQDHVYDPDSSPLVYLTQEQVDTACAKISCASPRDFAARDCIVQIENVRRQFCLGRIEQAEKSKTCRSLNESFREKFKAWIYQTEFSRKFYAQFGVEAL